MVQKRLHAGPTHFDKLKPEPGPNPTYNSDWHRLLLFSADPINEMPGRRCVQSKAHSDSWSIFSRI